MRFTEWKGGGLLPPPSIRYLGPLSANANAPKAGFALTNGVVGEGRNRMSVEEQGMSKTLTPEQLARYACNDCCANVIENGEFYMSPPEIWEGELGAWMG
jgi:hypothetical protein